MTTFGEYLGDDHKRCDELFALAEQAADSQDSGLVEANQQFVNAMEHHFGMEEGVLFPAFEETTGSAMGPTAVMRHEHEQMRQLFAQMTEAASAGNQDDYLGAAETLLILMQQHNAKEEQMLYPMSERILQPRQQELLQQMQSI